MSWRWLSKAGARAIHNEQLAEHGGRPGLRDEALLDSALSRPRNQAAYGQAGIARLAAAYAFGLARNHPFVDGNKRTAFVAAATFLLLNGWEITASEKAVVETFLRLAAGEMTEEQLAAWYEKYTAPPEQQDTDMNPWPR